MSNFINDKAFYLTTIVQTLVLIIFVIAIRISDKAILSEMKEHHIITQELFTEYRSDVKLNKEAI